MAARMKAADLREIIRAVVREEMRDLVATVVNEVMTERYLKKVVHEAVATFSPRQRAVVRVPAKLSEITNQDGDEDPQDIPEVLSNDDAGEGIYAEHPVKKETIDRDAILSMFFEGTKPLKEMEAGAEEGVPLSQIAPLNEGMTDRWRKLATAPSKVPTQAPTSQTELEMLEKRLAAKRAALEVPVKQ